MILQSIETSPNTTEASPTKIFMAKNCQQAKHGRRGGEMLQLTSP